jgi:hypothetical protein
MTVSLKSKCSFTGSQFSSRSFGEMWSELLDVCRDPAREVLYQLQLVDVFGRSVRPSGGTRAIEKFIHYQCWYQEGYSFFRDGPLDIWGGGGLGNFSVHEFFFYPQLLARIFFSATFLCTIFFLKWPKNFFRKVLRKSRRREGGGGHKIFLIVVKLLFYVLK